VLNGCLLYGRAGTIDQEADADKEYHNGKAQNADAQS
jgi:hypothetical protein